MIGPARNVVAGVVIVAVVVGASRLGWASVVGLWGPLAVAGAIVAATVALIVSTAARSDVRSLPVILTGGLVLKLVGTFARYVVASDVYEGSADAFVYHRSAALLGASIHEGVWSLEGTRVAGLSSSSQSVAWVLGALYSVTGPSLAIGFVVFGWLGWVGLVAFYRAFRLWLPDTDSRPFALLLFLAPTLLYWPSSIGKEALMLFLLGVVTLAIVKVVTGSGVGAGLVLGIPAAAAAWWLRPHVLLIVLGATLLAVLVPGRGASAQAGRHRVARSLVLVLVVPALVLAVGQVGRQLGKGDAGLEGVLDRTVEQTAQGGSVFAAQPVRGPADLPAAFVNVMLRPFAWQADNPLALVASLEGIVLIGVLVVRAPAVVRIPRLAWQHRGVAFGAAFVTLFVLAFSNIANAGILARQRTQLFPFLILVLGAALARPRPAVASVGSSVPGSKRPTRTGGPPP